MARRWTHWLTRKLEIGLDLTSHYSGTGAAEVAFAKTAGDALVSHSVCDINATCQDVLLHHSAASAPRHVFADLCQRPPVKIMEKLRRRLQEVQAEAGLSSPGRKSSAKPGCASTPAAGGRASTPAKIQALGRRWAREAMSILAEWTPMRDDQGACVRHPGCRCQIFHSAPADTMLK